MKKFFFILDLLEIEDEIFNFGSFTKNNLDPRGLRWNVSRAEKSLLEGEYPFRKSRLPTPSNAGSW